MTSPEFRTRVTRPSEADRERALAVLRDGTGIEKRFIEGADFPTGLATDDTYLYWANNDGTIGRSRVDGTEVDQDFITGADGPAGIAVG